MKRIYKQISTISFLVIIAVVTVLSFEQNRPTIYRQISCRDGLKYICYSNGDMRLRDVNANKFLTPKYDWIYEPGAQDTITVFCHKNQRGYLNCLSGEVIISAQYERAWIFSEGLAAVVVDGQLGFIDIEGNWAIAPRLHFSPESKHRTDFVFKQGFCTAMDSLHRFGIINMRGDWVVQPRFDYINNPEMGCRMVRKNGKFGMFDKDLFLAIPVEYDWMEITNVGVKVASSGIMKLLSYDGQTVLKDTIFEQVEGLLQYVGFNDANKQQYIDTGYSIFKINDKTGVIDENGRVVIPALYEFVRFLGPGQFFCSRETYGKIIKVKT